MTVKSDSGKPVPVGQLCDIKCVYQLNQCNQTEIEVGNT
jgi:hypothetical protein